MYKSNKKTKIFALSLSLISISNFQSKAQFVWDGSGISTHTIIGNVGIGIGPVYDARLHINNDLKPYLPFATSADNLPGQKIQRNFYQPSTITHGIVPANIFEIWHQTYDGMTGAPIGNNESVLTATNYKYVGINNAVPAFRLDVNGNGQFTENLKVGTDIDVVNDLNAGHNVNATNRLYVGDDANIGHKLYVTGQSYFTGSVTMTGSNKVGNTLYLDALAGSGDKLAVIDNIGAVTSQNIPTLGISGSTVTLSNGGSINSSITLPAGPSSGVNSAGLYTASGNLNMAGKTITNVTGYTGTGNITTTSGNVTASEYHFNGSSDVIKKTTTGGGGIQTSSPFAIGMPSTIGFALTVSGRGKFTDNIDVDLDVNSNRDIIAAHDVKAGNKVYAGTVALTSDRAFKTQIQALPNLKEMLFKLEPTQYYFKKNVPNRNFDDALHFGFIAQEVQKVFPNLVETIDEEGHVGLNYIEIIPLLLQTLKEEDAINKGQEEQIALLKKEIELLKNKSTTAIKNENVAVSSSSKLAQNVPNPFGRETKIGFEIHEDFTQAFIGIYNLNGQEIRKIQIQNGQSEITLNADQMEAGMYVYSLVVNNNLIDSKRMVITK